MKYLFHRRRIISLLCIISVILGMSAVSPEPIDAETVTVTAGPYTFVKQGNLIQLSGYNESKNPTGDVCLEKNYRSSDGNLWVTGIQETAFQKKSLSSLVVNTTNRTETKYYRIADKAFLGTAIGIYSGGSEPKAVFQGGEITDIGHNAFEGAKIGGDLIFDEVNGGIYSYAFYNMEVAGKLEIRGSLSWLDDYALAGAKMNELYLTTDIKEIGTCAFKDTPIREFPLPDTLTKLGSKVFEGCVLEKITLPSSDQKREIAEDAFPDQSGLIIIIPKKLTDLSVFHFENYKNLTFQTDKSLSEDSPVICWLKEHNLTYKVGENGPLITPGDISEPTPAPTPAATPTVTPAETPTIAPTQTPIPTPIPTETPAETPTVTPAETPTMVPTQTPIPTPIPTETPAETPTVTPAETPTTEPTQTPTVTPSTKPTQTPTKKPTATPTETPSTKPTATPTVTPEETPTMVPTKTPTVTPSTKPTQTPTVKPTATPAETPTTEPTQTPTVTPSTKPTQTPTVKPTATPTVTPAETPTTKPTQTPTVKPTATPAETPTVTPTEKPTVKPTATPTVTPTTEPTQTPISTSAPTVKPTAAPAEATTAILTETTTPEPAKETNPATTASSKKSVHIVKNIKYKINSNDTVTVIGVSKKTLKKLQIPDTVKIKGRLYKVTTIQNKAFKGLKKLKTVSVGNYVKTVGDEVFANCPKLKKIQFGFNLTKLGKKVLCHDKKLTKIIFNGKKLTQIGKKTFEGVPHHVDIRAVRSRVEFYATLIKLSKT